MNALESDTCSLSACSYEDKICDLDPYVDYDEDEEKNLKQRNNRPPFKVQGVEIQPKGYPGSSQLLKTKNGAQALASAFR